jgi:hypothetical protein
VPAVSKKQRRAMAIAEHHPEELSEKNSSLLGMSHGQLHDFASTPEKGLPERKEPGAFRKAARKKR